MSHRQRKQRSYFQQTFSHGMNKAWGKYFQIKTIWLLFPFELYLTKLQHDILITSNYLQDIWSNNTFISLYQSEANTLRLVSILLIYSKIKPGRPNYIVPLASMENKVKEKFPRKCIFQPGIQSQRSNDKVLHVAVPVATESQTLKDPDVTQRQFMIYKTKLFIFTYHCLYLHTVNVKHTLKTARTLYGLMPPMSPL